MSICLLQHTHTKHATMHTHCYMEEYTCTDTHACIHTHTYIDRHTHWVRLHNCKSTNSSMFLIQKMQFLTVILLLLFRFSFLVHHRLRVHVEGWICYKMETTSSIIIDVLCRREKGIGGGGAPSHSNALLHCASNSIRRMLLRFGKTDRYGEGKAM